KFAALLDVTPGEVHLDHVGLNHLTWELGVRLGGPAGENVLPRLIAEHGDAIADDLHMPRAVVDRLGVVPSYYLRYFYAHDEVVRELATKPSRAAQVAAMEKELLAMYGDPALDEKPALLAKRGGAFYSEAAVDLASGLLGSGGSPLQVVNTYNNGTLPFLPDDAVIEVQAAIDAKGAVPLAVPELDPLYAGLIANVTAYEDLALEAALRGGRDRVFKALLAHPLIGQFEYAEALTDKLLAHNREHLAWA
ncbi:6-phospho-beta-glucosidase, partial [Streptomyces sp. NPDC005795]